MYKVVQYKVVAALERVRVVATAAVTYIVAAAVAVSAFNAEIASAAPDGYEGATGVGTAVLAALAAAVAVIRRVTPVIEADRGLVSSIDWEAEIAELAETVDESEVGDEDM